MVVEISHGNPLLTPLFLEKASSQVNALKVGLVQATLSPY